MSEFFFKNDCCPKDCCGPVMTDCLAERIECLWKSAFCGAQILPCIGVPSNANCVMALTHPICEILPKLKINGLPVLSILANNAFYSAEVSCGRWVNLYSISLPNIPGCNGCKSSGEIYNEALIKLGISVEGDHYDWKGTCPCMVSINSKAIGMDPIEFSKKQIAAVKAIQEVFGANCCC